MQDPHETNIEAEWESLPSFTYEQLTPESLTQACQLAMAEVVSRKNIFARQGYTRLLTGRLSQYGAITEKNHLVILLNLMGYMGCPFTICLLKYVGIELDLKKSAANNILLISKDIIQFATSKGMDIRQAPFFFMENDNSQTIYFDLSLLQDFNRVKNAFTEARNSFCRTIFDENKWEFRTKPLFFEMNENNYLFRFYCFLFGEGDFGLASLKTQVLSILFSMNKATVKCLFPAIMNELELRIHKAPYSSWENFKKNSDHLTFAILQDALLKTALADYPGSNTGKYGLALNQLPHINTKLSATKNLYKFLYNSPKHIDMFFVCKRLFGNKITKEEILEETRAKRMILPAFSLFKHFMGTPVCDKDARFLIGQQVHALFEQDDRMSPPRIGR